MELATILNLTSILRDTKSEKRYRPGAGVILLRLSPQDNWEVLLVTGKKGSIGFPKGCQELYDKDFLETAIRELKEEVGIYQHQINLLLELGTYREDKVKNHSIGCGIQFLLEPYIKTNYYYIGVLKPEYIETPLKVDLKEISKAEWHDTSISYLDTLPLVTDIASSVKGISSIRLNMIKETIKKVHCRV